MTRHVASLPIRRSEEIHSTPQESFVGLRNVPALIWNEMKLTSVMYFTLDSYFQICWIKISYKWLKCYNKWFKPHGICGKQFNRLPEQLQDEEIWVMNSSSILMWGLHPSVSVCVLGSISLSVGELVVSHVARSETNSLHFQQRGKEFVSHVCETIMKRFRYSYKIIKVAPTSKNIRFSVLIVQKRKKKSSPELFIWTIFFILCLILESFKN